MGDITFTADTLGLIAVFESVTKTQVRDCMELEDKLVFVVEPRQANKAVGKKGENVIKLKNMTGKDIQVIEYSADSIQFVRNVFYIYNVQNVEVEDRTAKDGRRIKHATVTVDPEAKGRAIGKGGRNLRIARDMVSRHHDIQSISVA